jgi:hypothetical protein
MGEAAGTEEQELQDYLLRELISEGKLSYPVVQKIGGELITVTIKKNGPVVFLVTTTKNALHPENETRLLSLEVDDSQEQTKKVLSKVAQIIGMNAAKADIDFTPWHDFQRYLARGNRKVVVPFAEKLATMIPPKSVRLRRDFSQILTATKAHALLHRSHRDVNDRGEIVANIDHDYAVVAELMGNIVAEASGTKISQTMQATISAVEKATKNLPEDQGATSDKVGTLMKLDQSTAWWHLRSACTKGLIVNLETRRGQRGRYRVVADREVEKDEELLPSPRQVATYDAYVHTQPETVSDQEDDVCNTVCTDDCIREDDDPYAYASAYATACAKPLNGNGKVLPYARMHRMHAGTCQACDGKGCPTCRPREYGIGADPFDGLKDPSLRLKGDAA